MPAYVKQPASRVCIDRYYYETLLIYVIKAVRKNRYVILPADFEEAWKQTVKRSDETLEFCKLLSYLYRGDIRILTRRSQTGSGMSLDQKATAAITCIFKLPDLCDCLRNNKLKPRATTEPTDETVLTADQAAT